VLQHFSAKTVTPANVHAAVQDWIGEDNNQISFISHPSWRNPLQRDCNGRALALLLVLIVILVAPGLSPDVDVLRGRCSSRLNNAVRVPSSSVMKKPGAARPD
jgi:hypothetical protein